MTENDELREVIATYTNENAKLKAEVYDLEEIRAVIEKENEQLKEHLQKMRCCENCRHYDEGDCQSEHTYDCKYWNKHKRFTDRVFFCRL